MDCGVNPGDFLPVRISIQGTPRTKKNSQRIFKRPGGKGYFIAPSKEYKEYEERALTQIKKPDKPIDIPVNVQCTYYMPTARKVDLTNLLEATDDILVRAGVLADDNSDIVAGHDGSCVLKGYKSDPRVEVTIRRME